MDAIYKILFSSIEEGLIIADNKGIIINANPRTNDLFGYEDGELIGLSVNELIPFKLRKTHSSKMAEYHIAPSSRKMGAGINLKAKKKNGEEFYVEISLKHFKSKGDVRVVALITDISVRVEQEQKILELNRDLENKVEERTQEVRESQELYRAISRNFPNGTINVFDTNLRYIFAEGQQLREAGITSQQLIGTSYLDQIASEIRPKIKKALLSVFKGSHENFELESKGAYYNISVVPLKNSQNKIDRILLVERNITDQKIIQQQQEHALENERKLNDMKTRFVSMASHEFRTPLSTVLSSVSLIDKYIEKGRYENTTKHTQRIRNAVKGLTDILNDFLSVDKLESGQQKLQLSKFDYNLFAEDIAEEIRTICKKDQEIEINVKGKQTNIITDLTILKNILYNLLSNAIKYSKEGQKIIFNSIISDHLLEITIQDFGMGIPKKEQKQLFSRFFRGSNVFNIEGTGLGLHIVIKYLDMLDGKITFESEENTGTTFKIIIPLNNSTTNN